MINNLNIKPDMKLSVKQTFGIDTDMEVSAFSSKNELILVFSLNSSGISSLVTDDDSPKYLIVSCLDVFFLVCYQAD